MANTFTISLTPPDPLMFGVGQVLMAPGAGRFSNLVEAMNWLHAYGASQNVAMQGWGANLCQAVPVMPGAGTTHARWRFPQINAAFTTVRASIFAGFAGGAGNGQVRFQSVTGAGTVTINVAPGAAAWYSSAALAVAFGPGYEEINMTVAGDGVSATTVHEAILEYRPLTSPLAAAMAGAVVPLDALEADADSCCASDLGTHMLTDLTELFVRPRTYYQWSDLTGIQAGMRPVEHTLWLPVHYGALDEAPIFDVTVHVEATGAGGASRIYIYHNWSRSGHPGAPATPGSTAGDHTIISVGAGAARQWYTTTIRLADERRLDGLPHPAVPVTIWPGTRTAHGVGGFGSGLRQQNDGNATPTIHTISMWGR